MKPMVRRPIILIWFAALALATGCGSARLGRALAEGKRHYQAQEWRSAIEAVERGLTEEAAEKPDPYPSESYMLQTSDALLLIGRCYRKLGQPVEAFRNFNAGASTSRMARDPHLEVELQELRREY